MSLNVTEWTKAATVAYLMSESGFKRMRKEGICGDNGLMFSSLSAVIQLKSTCTNCRGYTFVFILNLTYLQAFSHLEFPPGVKLLQALDRLLSVHHGGHRRALLWRDGERTKIKHQRGEALTVTGLCGQELSEILAFLQMCWFWGSLGDDIFGKKPPKMNTFSSALCRPDNHQPYV